MAIVYVYFHEVNVKQVTRTLQRGRSSNHRFNLCVVVGPLGSRLDSSYYHDDPASRLLACEYRSCDPTFQACWY